MLTEELIEKAKSGDMETLVTLDANGFLIAPNENPQSFAKRLRTLLEKLTDLKKQVSEKEFYEIEGMKFKSDGLIPKHDFLNSMEKNQELYDFSIDWVPGFYQNPSMGWLFGGCCYTSEPDFFSFFQVRETFKLKNKWMFYNRDELVAHELCHVARSGIDAKKFEEFFAYKTSPKKFRRGFGSALYSTIDTYMILIASISLPVIQYLRLNQLIDVPFWPFLTFLSLLIGNFVRRYFSLKNNFEKAKKKLEPFFGCKGQSVLFRCSDNEIFEIAKLSKEKLSEKVSELTKNDLRWQIINQRFGVK